MREELENEMRHDLRKYIKQAVTLALVLCIICTAMPVLAQSKLEIKTAKIVNTKTRGVKDEQKKLKKLFKYVETFGYKRVVGFTAKKGWEKTYALEMLNSKKGSCYHYAAAYAFLAKKATGYQVRIRIGKTNGFNKAVWQDHAWCEIKIGGKWYVFDPNMDKFAANAKGRFYNKLSTSKAMKKVYKAKKTVKVKF